MAPLTLVLKFGCTLFQGLIRLLSICASGSLLAVKTLLLLGISGTLKDILSGSALISGASVSPAVTRPADQVHISITDLGLDYSARAVSLSHQVAGSKQPLRRFCGGKACLSFSLPQTPLMWEPPALGLPLYWWYQ